MSIQGSHTFGQDFKTFLQKGGNPSEFALEIANPNRHVSISYVVAKITGHDASLRPTVASFEMKDMQIPHGEEIVYSSELKGLLKNIQETTRLLSQSNVIDVTAHFEHPDNWGLGQQGSERQRRA